MRNHGKLNGLTPLTGATRDGLPLAYSRAPRKELQPWLSSLGVTRVDLAAHQTISCAMLNESASMRILFGSSWSAVTASGPMHFDPGEAGKTLLFGPHSRAMPVSVQGSFAVVTVNFAAGAMRVLGGPKPGELLDRILDYDRFVGHGRLGSRLEPDADPEAWLAAIENELGKFIELRQPDRPDPLVVSFEQATLANPGFALEEFAKAHNVSRRTLERIIRGAIGVTPHHALRRARAMDMAAVLLGVAIEDEEPELRLRYFDQSHLTREMHYFFDCTPGQMVHEPHPLLRIGTEIRQARRVNMLERVKQGELVPWRDPAAEPASPKINRTAS